MKSNELSGSDAWTEGNAVLLHVSYLAFLECCNYLAEYCLKMTVFLFLPFSVFNYKLKQKLPVCLLVLQEMLMDLSGWRSTSGDNSE